MKNLKIAFRNLLKNKVVSTINLLGLTLGIVISLLLFSYVRQEKDTDKFIKDYENIYMLSQNDELSTSYISRPAIALLRDRFPDIPITNTADDFAEQVFLLDDNGNSFKVNNLLNTDSSFFSVFQFEAVAGDMEHALDVASRIVLRESLAKKIFGNQNPIGKTLRLNTTFYNNQLVEVSAVLKDFPENSAWTFDAVTSITLNDEALYWYKSNADHWGAGNYIAFCRLPSNIDPDNFSQQLKELSKSPEVTENVKWEIAFTIRPYSQLFLNTPQGASCATTLKKGNLQTFNVLEFIATLILLMACINYVNLVSAQRQKRNKSVAVVKMLGSQTWGVIQIFLFEAGLLLLAVLGLCVLFIPLVLELFNGLIGTHYTISLFFMPQNLVLAVAIFGFTLLITGLLPGLIFGRYQALRLIKPTTGKQRGGFFRSVLPVLQFSVAIGLIASLFAIKKQNDMMLNQNPGYQREHIVYATLNSGFFEHNAQSLTNEFKSISGVSDITFADADFVDVKQNWGVDLHYDSEAKTIGFVKIGVTPNFFDFFGLKFTSGQNFVTKEANYSELIFNQAAMREYGIDDFEKARIMGDGRIVGVIEDFNFKSAHYPIQPICFMNNGEVSNFIYLKTTAQSHSQLKTVIADIEKCWNRLSPNIPFEYKFLDKEWDALYKREIQFQKLFVHAGWISIFIACLGLFGLSMFVAEQRTKEIGIRKINGATVGEILTLLNTSFVKWIIVAFVIATPLAYFAMTKWLENFAYKTTLSWWIFALAGLSALIVALVTVSWQSWRAANRNPVESLKYE
ncbi:MAG TPA: ABC transporter permease [Salinivirgaceae bacterium]|nr:ABC transporter permease [Salinivirgaceae bacterium]